MFDEANLLVMAVLRKLGLLFDRFRRKNPGLVWPAGLTVRSECGNQSRITFSQTLLPRNDGDLEQCFVKKQEAMRLAINTMN